MNIETLALNSNSEGYGLSHVPRVSLATGLLKQSLDKSTRYYCLSDGADKEAEESGLYYIAKNDAGKKLEDIVFEKDYLPRGNEFKRKVAFLDRDGILIKDTDYPGKVEDVIFLPEVLPLLESLKQKGFEFVVVTNQSGIARAKYTVEDFKKTTAYIEEHYKKHGIDILETFFCPYHISGIVKNFARESIYRKPMPGMHLAASEKYQIDLSTSIMIGDRASDKVKLSALACYTVGSTYKDADFKSFADLRDYLITTLN